MGAQVWLYVLCITGVVESWEYCERKGKVGSVDVLCILREDEKANKGMSDIWMSREKGKHAATAKFVRHREMAINASFWQCILTSHA